MKDSDEQLDLNINHLEIRSHSEYRALWEKIGRIQIRCIEKNEECKHAVGDVFFYENPYKRPSDVCEALLHVIDLYIWRVALGFPSWNSDDRRIYKIHCPDPKGTIWEIEKVTDD